MVEVGGGGLINNCSKSNFRLVRLRLFSKILLQHGIKVKYNWKKMGMEKNVKCLDSEKSCQQQVCECDKDMAICIRDVLAKGLVKCPEATATEILLLMLKQKRVFKSIV